MKLYETITAENWTKHTLDGCLVGHAQKVYPLEVDRKLVLLELDKAILAIFADRLADYRGERNNTFRAAVRLNDHPATTLDDVLRVCKLADV